jgi:hypothetical protein
MYGYRSGLSMKRDGEAKIEGRLLKLMTVGKPAIADKSHPWNKSGRLDYP